MTNFIHTVIIVWDTKINILKNYFARIFQQPFLSLLKYMCKETLENNIIKDDDYENLFITR